MHTYFDQRRYLIPFRSILLPQIFTDTLVIGGGAAGLSAALSAREHGDVIVLAKSSPMVSNTGWAQGGIAAVLDERDSIESHVRDTLVTGAGLCDEAVVRSVINAAPDAMRWLFDGGFRVDRDDTGGVSLGREGGHNTRRIVHSNGDATGRELERSLLERTTISKGIRVFENCFALDLLTQSGSDQSPCLGAITHHPRYGLQIIWARATILASGGSGVLWRETTNPWVATADGLAMAYRAGASLSDLAFMQFHPTTLYIAGAPRMLISEAVRGEGAVLLDDSGSSIMQEVHPLGDLAPRDIVSRSIQRARARQGAAHVWLDARSVSDFAGRFPSIAQALARFEINPAKDLIPVNPAAHYMIGGVHTDMHGRTDVPGLYAVGEASCTGLHGANRLASNSLLESIVLGRAAGSAAMEMSAPSNAWGVSAGRGPAKIVSDIPLSQQGELDLTDVRSSLRSVMWRNVGIERRGGPLQDVEEMFDFWARYTLDKILDDPTGWETQNMLLVGALVTRAASWRKESRGCHARTDFPEPAEELAVHDSWRKGSNEPFQTPVGAEAAA